MRISNMPMMGKVLVIVALTSAGAAALGGLVAPHGRVSLPLVKLLPAASEALPAASTK